MCKNKFFQSSGIKKRTFQNSETKKEFHAHLLFKLRGI
jgi:hypothetical protein